jgi:hypothetical protein
MRGCDAEAVGRHFIALTFALVWISFGADATKLAPWNTNIE